MVNGHEIYVGATYRMSGRNGEVVEVTAIDKTHVSYRGTKGFMSGGAPIDYFAKDASRVFLHKPSVDDVVEMIKRMDSEQRTELAKRVTTVLSIE